MYERIVFTASPLCESAPLFLVDIFKIARFRGGKSVRNLEPAATELTAPMPLPPRPAYGMKKKKVSGAQLFFHRA